jgi:hypothetical protein
MGDLRLVDMIACLHYLQIIILVQNTPSENNG